MKEDIRKHCKTCATCMLHKLENMKFEKKIFKPSLQPMDFICMDLIGEFHPPTSCGHHYALTAVCIEGFHRFLKMCISKHINHGLEWDELTPMATACYNFFPDCNARESAFFIMFRRDPINRLNILLHSARRYFHDNNGLPNLEALKNIYQVVAQQLLNSRECYVKKHHNQQRSESPVQAGDFILIKDNTAKSFQPLYKGNYRVVKAHDNNMEI